ncbi:SURF1 family protein [Chloroflexus sp.]|uniref:SURF1 family protein n=1 Tax=Chloroflexus sp. TaxID=1904827 RepID=UPI00298F3AAF|nr:SURF1 family protein [Chloroflexus sp.]MCX7859830.1 SURF1 family protein [Chloroflexus sp.]MDW8405878.1 SURF1 family protein [Chloroflexus sp.]
MTTTTSFAPHRLLRGWWIAKHLFALVIFTTLIVLGFWQLDRLEQRRAANAARLAALAQPAIPLTPDTDPAIVIGRRVVVSGVFRNEEGVVLRGRRSDNGVDGVHLLTPLQIEGSEQAVLVDRGWIPSAQGATTAYAVTRPVTIEGIARAPQLRPDSPLAGRDLPLPGETRIQAWLRVDVPAIQRQVGAPLLPLFIEQLPDGSAGLPRPPDPYRVDEGPHLNYALQWFTFAGIVGVGYILLLRQELRRG